MTEQRKTADNTSFVEMVHPGHGGTVKIPVSPRHNGGGERSLARYRRKGFRTVEEHKLEEARKAELAAAKAEAEAAKAEADELRGKLEAKAAKPETGKGGR